MGFIQSKSASNDATATSIAVVFTTNVLLGSLICVQIAHGGTTDQVLTLTDTVGTIYTERKFLAGANVSGSVWSGVTTAAGANTVTATFAVTSTFRRIAVHEVSGFTEFVGANATRFAAGACGNSGNITTTDNCYVFGCMHADQGGDFTIAAGTNVAWTLRENYQHANAPAGTEDFIQTAPGTLNAAFTEGSCTIWRIYYVMAFKAAGAASVLPTYFGSGTFTAAAAAAITPPFPANCLANDVAVMFCESENQAIALGAGMLGAGFKEVTNSPQGTGTAGAAGSTRLSAFWKRLIGGGSDPAPQVANPGDHVTGQIHVFRDVRTWGLPWNITAGGVEASSDVSGLIPGATTTLPNCLVVAACSTSVDATGTANFSAWANADLTLVTERADNNNLVGLGGGHGMATGNKVTAGAYTTTGVTYSVASLKGMMSIALLGRESPAVPGPTFPGERIVQQALGRSAVR